MAYDYPRLVRKIVDVVSIDSSVTDRMNALISECEAQRPHPHWNQMRQVDFDADNVRISNWLSSAFEAANDHPPACGLWFGLVNVELAGTESAEAYVAASSAFEATSIDWAAHVERVGEDNYLGSSVLRAIYAQAYGSADGLRNDAEYPLVLAFGAIAARSALMEAYLPSTLKSVRGAAVGFDSGDFLYLGEYSRGKFASHVRAG